MIYSPQMHNSSDFLNYILSIGWEIYGAQRDIPVGAAIAITPEYIELHRQWGWGEEWISRLKTTPYMVVSEYRGGGPCICFPDGTWDGGVDFDIIKRCRDAYPNINSL